MRANRSALRCPNGRGGGACDPVAMARQLDMVIVGAGFAGLYMLHEARTLGLETEVIEAGDGVGGTWYWNRYPGARCDTPSMEYSYGWHEALQQEWEWSEKYATQPEILAYLDHVADRFDLRRDITFGTRVEACSFDEAAERWTVRSSDGQERIAALSSWQPVACHQRTSPPSRAATISVVGPSTRADGHTRESTSPVAAWR